MRRIAHGEALKTHQEVSSVGVQAGVDGSGARLSSSEGFSILSECGGSQATVAGVVAGNEGTHSELDQIEGHEPVKFPD